MMFLFSHNEKRYHTLSYHYAHNGGKVVKACLDGGFTCPNIDGTCGVGGCTYCLGGSGYFTTRAPLQEQLKAEIARLKAKDPEAKIVGYLQSNSGTYGTVERLREIYGEICAFPGIHGLTVATRADCISPEIVSLLKEFSVKVELGLQTVHDETAKRIHRGHSFDAFVKGYSLLKNARIPVCVHLIDGLPGETAEMMVESAKVLGQLRPDGVKIHALHLLKGTQMAKEYESAPFSLLSREEYADIVVGQLEVLPPETVIERLTGDGDKRLLVAPTWTGDKKKTLALIDRRLAEKDTRQGRLYKY